MEELPFSGKAPNGDTIAANSHYFVKNDKPWYPIMGEFHFSRYSCEEWERELLQSSLWTTDLIAEALGFYDTSHFYRVYKRVTGQTPRGE